LGLTLAGSKGQKGDELPRNGLSLCEFFYTEAATPNYLIMHVQFSSGVTIMTARIKVYGKK